MLINLNCVIGILLILVIIYILYNKKQEVFIVNPTLSPEELLNQKLEKLEELVISCFEESSEPKSVTEFLDKEFLDANIQEVYSKLDELILAVKSGGNVYLDGTKVGTAMNVGTYKVQ